MNIKPDEWVLVFDLDDTLYAEYAYKCSGIRAVCALVSTLYPQFDAQDLYAALDTKSSGWLEALCRRCGLNDAEKQSLLWHYRLHAPEIQTFMPSEKLNALIQRFAAAALISDGRSISQRQKLKALGLLEAFDLILISEEWGEDKPAPKRFAEVESRFPAKRYIYVGDNVKKDFVTPKRMGWLTVGITARADNIHQAAPDLPSEYQPDRWLDSVADLEKLLMPAGHFSDGLNLPQPTMPNAV
ncbi:HAD family hydrolase [Neisseria chenwenguii]|uniref:Haloacid dehalogenase n=1 Tax=Neisseria chenwenguii TaxID=1853278 RepID=A0A220S087_9NEIS|nr:HAD family hydrolase [Neisseria chenwenguii]ASK26857.1 haloacid dehalogenase [Neisseria chenwenguii]ROV56835.1 HAD family hydrolase [Neisseria chenwenguii]